MFVLKSGFGKGPIVLVPEALKSIPHLCSLSPALFFCNKAPLRERPADYTGLAFMIHATEAETERGSEKDEGEAKVAWRGGGRGTLRGPGL